ncbi:MAG: hypothetical protein ACRDBG_07710 [Waterburya sp.]
MKTILFLFLPFLLDGQIITTPVSTSGAIQNRPIQVTNNSWRITADVTNNTGTLETLSTLQAVEAEEKATTFEYYFAYTTGATSQGIKFKLDVTNQTEADWYYTYDFPETGGTRFLGYAFNTSLTHTLVNSAAGTNIGVIRGVLRDKSPGSPFAQITIQFASEDGASSCTILAGTLLVTTN